LVAQRLVLLELIEIAPREYPRDQEQPEENRRQRQGNAMQCFASKWRVLDGP